MKYLSLLIVFITGCATTTWANSWYKNGQLHREAGPAKEYADGSKVWYKNGQLHREDGPAAEWSNGGKDWYKNGQLHREDGPAIERANGEKYWYKNGQLHREDGPAIERADGSKSWYLNGVELSESEFLKRTQPTELTLEQIAERFNIPVESLKIKK